MVYTIYGKIGDDGSYCFTNINVGNNNHKPSPRHHHKWKNGYVYISQSWVVYDIVLPCFTPILLNINLSNLFGGLNPSEKYYSVGVIIPNIWENKKCSKPPTINSHKWWFA